MDISFMNMCNHKLSAQILRFLVVGGTAFLIDFGTLWVLTNLFSMNYLLANSISFTTSVIYNYILSTVWVFDTKANRKKGAEFSIFLLLSLVGLGINQGILWITVERAGINYLFSKILATGLVMVFNFITRKRFLEN